MSDFLKDLMKELNAYENQKPEKKEKKQFKLPFLKLVFLPFGFLVDNAKNIFIAIAVYSLLSTVLSMLTGNFFICSLPAAKSSSLYCSQTVYLYALHSFIKIFIISGFVIVYHNIVSKKRFNIEDIFKLDLKYLKFCGVIFAFLILNLIPLVSLSVLYFRVPNPDWRMESLFFTVVSIGFLVPFVLMRFYAEIVFFIDNDKFYSFKKLWNKTKGNGLKIITALFMIILFSVILFANFYTNFSNYIPKNIWWAAISSEYVYNLAVFIIIGLIVGHFYVQKKFLIDDEEG